MSVTPLRAGHGGAVPLSETVAKFLDRYRDEPGTWVTYAETLTHLTAAVGDGPPTVALTSEVFAAVMSRWDDKAPATWNKHLTALRSFAAYALRQEWITVDPARHLEGVPVRNVSRAPNERIPNVDG
jgi:site-specific recombinase XerD